MLVQRDRAALVTTVGARRGASVGRRRVLVIVQNLPVPLDRRVWLECRALVQAGYQVSVICPKGPGDPSFQVLESVRIRKYRPPPKTSGPLSYALEFVYCWVRTALLALRALTREGFDVVQACNPPDTYWALALPLKLLGKKFVYDQHDLCPEVYMSRFVAENGFLLSALRQLERACYRYADHVISTNESYRRVALERGRLQAEDVTVVRSGPDSKVMRRGAAQLELKRNRRFLAVYLGIMGPQDGVDILLRAIKILVHERGQHECTFALLGFGDCLKSLESLAHDLDLDEWVTFTGRAGPEMISAYLSTADIGLSPDPMNPLNDISTMNKTLEYMAFELPVVAFDLTETRVSAGKAAVYVPPSDPRDYATAVESLLGDPGRRARMGKLGRQQIEERLGWEHHASRYVQVYNELYERPRRPRRDH
ncbi:MAG: glycosyltransferase family 4 protein [Egibacteraceae bacterium]